MDKQIVDTRIKQWIKISLWILFLALFFYSFQSIMDIEEMADPTRQASVMRMLTAFANPDFSDGEAVRQASGQMWITFQMGFLATTISAALAMPFTFFSARPTSSWGCGFSLLLQPILAAVRAVHPLFVIFPAIVFAGVGHTAGVLALSLFSTAVLIGIFSEYAQQHPSLNWRSLFRVHFPGLAFKHLPVNILIASVLGYMGGGGIGFLLIQDIHLLNYRDASVKILACIVVIGSIDLISRAVWRKIHIVR